MGTGAAAIIIGNEVLTAKVTEANGAWLVKRLRERGVLLHSVHFVLDEVDAIVEAVSAARRRARWIFTSGGIGPTHDDVTVRAVALALGRAVVRLPQMEQMVRDHYGDRIPPEALRLAEAPEGCELISQPEARYPVLACDDVYMLPGVPQLFRLQLETVLRRLPVTPVHLQVLYLDAAEADVAGAIDTVALAMPEVAIGSYPTFDLEADYRVKVTLEHAEAGPVATAVKRLEALLPAGCLLRRE
ncbi:MAG: molybdopterin-binding protein [Myxococcaceae bacterium]|nr:molybdopterin-binding protein [Myxococcaceae bacterium]